MGIAWTMPVPESFFSHLKTEKIYLNEAANKAEVEQQVSEYILFYNQNQIFSTAG
ncbi:IS3 family transposase [Paenibacillus sp. QZ-Y1]|uniref:IS3 family transposase n=1 Tax=Paenibacillus sp. QZ-Y1 TaxID=3414511 RepID=UPI003F79172C